MQKPSLAALALLIVASACDPSNPPISQAPGEYRGVLSQVTPQGFTQVLVKATALAPTATSLTVAVIPEGSDAVSLEAELKGTDRLVLRSPLLTLERELTLGEDGCFLAEESKARACYDGHELLIELQATARGDVSIVLERYNPASDPVLESPADFTSDEIRDRAVSMSFESRIEFERVLQARLNARVNWFNLLPNFTLSTIIGLASIDASFIVRSIGNLAPFLLPTRWMRARQASQLAAAERYAWYAMKADAGSIAEGISLAILKDERSRAILAEHRKSIVEIRDRILGFESLGIVAEGASDDITSMVSAADLSMQLLDTLLVQQRAALAMASGFMNPRAIAQLTPGTLADPATATELDEQEIARIALIRSYELRQLDALIAQTRSTRTQRIFGWIDPGGGGGDGGNFGFGLPDYVRIGNSQVRELELKRQQLQALLLQKTVNAVAEARGLAASFRTARADTAIQERRLARLTGNLSLGISISLTELVSALQGRMKSDLDVNNSDFGYRAARARIDRLTLAGPYADVERQ